MTDTQKEFCRERVEEFLNKVNKITKKNSKQCIRISDGIDHRKKDQEFNINVYFRSESKKYWLISH